MFEQVFGGAVALPDANRLWIRGEILESGNLQWCLHLHTSMSKYQMKTKFSIYNFEQLYRNKAIEIDKKYSAFPEVQPIHLTSNELYKINNPVLFQLLLKSSWPIIPVPFTSMFRQCRWMSFQCLTTLSLSFISTS